MLYFGLCMLLGVFTTHQAESLPSAPWLLSLGVVAIALLPIRVMRGVGAFLLGILLASSAATTLIDSRLDPKLEGQATEFGAIVEDFPTAAGDSLRIVVVPIGNELPERIRLSWYGADQQPNPGELWQFNARLRAPRGFANPDGFDYEGWLFRSRIGATGYIVSAKQIETGVRPGLVIRLRQRFLDRVHTLLPEDAARAVLSAVTIGARQDISREQWDRYAKTGTSHLMAISGLHIGLAAAGLFLLVRLLAAPFACGRNVRDIAMFVATAGATSYAILSGLAIPAQRALLMVLFVAVAMLRRRQHDYFRTLSIVAVIVLAADPLASLTPGFQLSFLAVLLLLLAGQQSAPKCRWPGRPRLSRAFSPISRLVVLQCVLLLGLLPVTVLQFGRIAWLAPIVNLLVLPVFNLCTVPLALLGFLLDGPLQAAGDKLLLLSWYSIRLVLGIVDIASELPGAELKTLPLRSAMRAALWATALWALLPPGFPGRAVAWIAALAVVAQEPEVPPVNCIDLHVLDVGQGLSVVMQTQAHIAVFDTGPSFRSGSNTATLVVVPFLQSLGVPRIDKLIISHADLDHAGGVASVLASFEVGELMVGETLDDDDIPLSSMSRCATGMRWQWDGIEFKVLHPDPLTTRTGNNASCVLQLSANGQRALLSGDIERPVELMLAHQGLLQPSQLVVVPHHGSRTSSTAVFVEALQAEFAIVSAGYGNRWGFPRPDVVQRWEQSGANVLTTADSGAISQRICSGATPGRPREQRSAYRRYWHARRESGVP